MFYGNVSRAFDWADMSIVDKIARGSGSFGAWIGEPIRQLQTGQLQSYALAISVGMLVIFGIFLFVR